jgi:hypothetical protein
LGEAEIKKKSNREGSYLNIIKTTSACLKNNKKPWKSECQAASSVLKSFSFIWSSHQLAESQSAIRHVVAFSATSSRAGQSYPYSLLGEGDRHLLSNLFSFP